MYRIFVDGKVICDSRIDELAVISPVVKKKANTVEEFSFTITKDHQFYDEIQRRRSVIEVQRDDETVFRGTAITEEVDFYLEKTFYCESELTYLNDSIQRPYHYQEVTVLELLRTIIANHNSQVDDFKKFEVGNVTVVDPGNRLSCFTNMGNTMTEIKNNLVDVYGGFIRVRRQNNVNYIDYLAESTHDCGQSIVLGKNMIDYVSNIDSAEIATSIIPLGAKQETSTIEGLEERLTIKSVNGGRDYLQSEAADTYGVITKVITWDDVEDPGELKNKGLRYLQDIQFENVVIEAAAVDFGYISNSIEKFDLLDRVRIKSIPHGMDRYFVLTEMSLQLNNPESDTFVFGSEQKKSLSARTNAVNSEVMKAISQIAPANDILKMAKDQASSLIKAGQTGYVTIVTDDNGNPDEICIADSPVLEEAEKVWRWNSGGFGYSSTGYDGEFGTAITMDGQIVAEYIAAGSFSMTGGSIQIESDSETRDIIELNYGTYKSTMSASGFYASSTHNSSSIGIGVDKIVAKYGNTSKTTIDNVTGLTAELLTGNAKSTVSPAGITTTGSVSCGSLSVTGSLSAGSFNPSSISTGGVTSSATVTASSGFKKVGVGTVLSCSGSATATGTALLSVAGTTVAPVPIIGTNLGKIGFFGHTTGGTKTTCSNSMYSASTTAQTVGNDLNTLKTALRNLGLIG